MTEEIHGNPIRPLSEDEYRKVRKKAVQGVVILSVRRVVLQIIQTIGSIILARLLLPESLGTFAIIIFLVNFLTFFTDFGFSGSLIQQKEPVTNKQLRTLFTLQLISSTVLALTLFMIAPLIVQIFGIHVNEESVTLTRVMSFVLMVNIFKSIPTALLEKEMNYKNMVIAEVIETVTIVTVTLFAVTKGGNELTNLVLGTVVGKVIGAVAYTMAAPWQIGIGWSIPDMRKSMSFGVPYQLSQIIGQINGSVVPIVVGLLTGSVGVGMVNWAGGIAALPRVASEVISRVMFPFGAQLQNDRETLRRVLEKTLDITNMVSFLLIALLVGLAHEITYIIFTDKWLPAVPSLYLFSIQSVFVVIGSIVINTLLAIGKAKEVRNINIVWAVLQWIMTIPLVKIFGFNGLALAGLLVSITTIIPIMILKKEVTFSLSKCTVPYMIAGTITAGALEIAAKTIKVTSVWHLLAYVATATVVYAILIIPHAKKYLPLRRTILKE